MAKATNNTNAVMGWSQSGILGSAGTLFFAPRTDIQNTGIGFWTANQGDLSAGPINRMYIHANGNVGIGTTNPGSYKLAVEGKIGAHEIKVTTAGWADFVFHDDYVLRPLADVEQFIKEKGHLPDVPSEAEVLENGIEVGAINATLLQKIEELTLYVIEQNKKISALEEKVNQLQK